MTREAVEAIIGRAVLDRSFESGCSLTLRKLWRGTGWRRPTA